MADGEKGERLLVLHKLPQAQLQSCREKLAKSDLPSLWRPRADCFFHVDAFPVLARIFHTLNSLRNGCLQATKEYAGARKSHRNEALGVLGWSSGEISGLGSGKLDLRKVKELAAAMSV